MVDQRPPSNGWLADDDDDCVAEGSEKVSEFILVILWASTAVFTPSSFSVKSWSMACLRRQWRHQQHHHKDDRQTIAMVSPNVLDRIVLVPRREAATVQLPARVTFSTTKHLHSRMVGSLSVSGSTS